MVITAFRRAAASPLQWKFGDGRGHLHKFPHAMLCSASNYVILRMLLLQHQPLHLRRSGFFRRPGESESVRMRRTPPLEARPGPGLAGRLRIVEEMRTMTWNRRQMLLAAGAALIAPGAMGRALAVNNGSPKKVLFFTKSSGFQHSV